MREMNLSNIHIYCKSNFAILSFLMTGLLLQSCEKELGPLTTNSVIYGSATLYWSNEPDPNQITVVASGPYGEKSTMVDASGSYMFTGMGNGTYYLDFSQEGYGTIRQYGIQVYGNDTVLAQPAYLFKLIGPFDMPSFKDAYSTYRDGIPFISIETDMIQPSYSVPMPIILFLGTGEDVSWESNRYSSPAIDYGTNEVGALTLYLSAPMLPFESGTRVFVMGYVCNYDEYYAGSLDTYHGKNHFSTLDKTRHSNTVSFIMP